MKKKIRRNTLEAGYAEFLRGSKNARVKAFTSVENLEKWQIY